MKRVWNNNTKIENLFRGDEFWEWQEFNRFAERGFKGKYSIKERIILFCRYRYRGFSKIGKPKLMSMEDISYRTGIPLAEIKEFMKYMRTPTYEVSPLKKSEIDEYTTDAEETGSASGAI